MPRSPSGDTSVIVTQYYHWLYANHLAGIPAERINILWSGPFYIYFFLLMLGGLLFVYAWWTTRAHRPYGELYGVESFGGVILERIGPIEIFTWVFSAVMILWAAYFFVTLSLWGQVY